MLISRLSILFRFHSKGFTLIEMLVILGVLGVLSAFLIGYSRQSGEQLLVVTNQARLVSLIFKAKSLSITTFVQGVGQSEIPGTAKLCGYGVHIDLAGTAFIFRDRATDCSLLLNDYRYNAGSSDEILEGDLNSLKLDSSVTRFSSDSTLTDIVFIPPDPQVIINNGTITTGEAEVGIETKSQSINRIVKVTNAGNITTSVQKIK